jgi:O-methyltransferase involved in polyketide biosynthesis
MIIADTSALVLNWTSKDTWKTDNARNYFDALDLSSAAVLHDRFDKEMHFIQFQMLSNRKFFVRKAAVEFLAQCKVEQVNGQVIILAAGIDPLSIELASLFSDSMIFDVDKYSLQEKEKYLDHACPNIKFAQCDITNIELLETTLVEKGWNSKQPCILIVEGITYYLTEIELRKVLTFFSKHMSNLVCDFGLQPACVDAAKRLAGIEIVRKIKESVQLAFMNCYEPGYFTGLVQQCGFEKPVRYSMAAIQAERTGEISPFEGEEPAWVSLVKN